MEGTTLLSQQMLQLYKRLDTTLLQLTKQNLPEELHKPIPTCCCTCPFLDLMRSCWTIFCAIKDGSWRSYKSSRTLKRLKAKTLQYNALASIFLVKNDFLKCAKISIAFTSKIRRRAPFALSQYPDPEQFDKVTISDFCDFFLAKK